ncbi:MAG: hypothetical protein JRE28_15040 [Deltaproteobacteria bacterium]|nr:hypothetical protein [Deltaproteobacteria bacterium]
MKNIALILSVVAAFLSPLILSCSDDNNVNPVYDLKTLSRVFEEFGSTTESRAVHMIHKKRSGHAFLRKEQASAPGVRGALSQESTNTKETYTYEYSNNAHLYWTKATGKDALGNTVATATQTLDGAGFPTRCMWYDGAGTFDNAYDYTYDKNLYLRISVICYIDDPTDNPDARRDYEYSNVWNKDAIIATQTLIEYDLNGIKTYEYKWRSTTLKNSLRGAGGEGQYEYYKEYNEGLLTYQEKVTFDSDGYPQTLSIDNTGDGVYEETYHAETAKTVEGYLASVIWIEDDTGDKKWKETFAYDEEGLLKTTKYYDVVDGEFVLDTIITDVWYKNPVNGPTGGIDVYFESDESGKPIGEYETVDWTVTKKTRRYYSAPGEEIRRITDFLETVRLQ